MTARARPTVRVGSGKNTPQPKQLSASTPRQKRECSTLLQSLWTGEPRIGGSPRIGGLTVEMCRRLSARDGFTISQKAFRVWQDAALGTADPDSRARLAEGGPYAKTDNDKRLRYRRRFFRHELVSALALMNEGGGVAGFERKRSRDLSRCVASRTGASVDWTAPTSGLSDWLSWNWSLGPPAGGRVPVCGTALSSCVIAKPSRCSAIWPGSGSCGLSLSR